MSGNINELEMLSSGLLNSDTLLLKRSKGSLQCLFLKEGIAQDVVHVKCKILSEALLSASLLGIIEGSKYDAFKNDFQHFCFHVKARKLYHELKMTEPVYTMPLQQNLAVAEG